MPPKRHFGKEATDKMKSFLDEQLGRRYSVKGIVRRKKNKGIHCSQLASSTINLTSKLTFEDCHLITPKQLIDDVAPYYPTRRLAELPEHVDTRSSCRKSWDRFKRKFLFCSWSCREAFSWFW